MKQTELAEAFMRYMQVRSDGQSFIWLSYTGVTASAHLIYLFLLQQKPEK